MRRLLANIPQELWSSLWPEDPHLTFPHYVAETLDNMVWGGQQQIIVAAHLFGVSIHVQTPFGLETYGHGPTWHLIYDTHPVGHYDVFDPTPQEVIVIPSPCPAPPLQPAPLLALPKVSPPPLVRPTNPPPGKPVHLGGHTSHLIHTIHTINLGGR